jgi:NADH-quinone oxidoreductase subunit M
MLNLPWLDLAIASAVVGSILVSRLRDPDRAFRWGLAFIGTKFVCTLLASLSFYSGIPAESVERWSAQAGLFGRSLFRLDELNAPLVPVVALLHFLTALATARTHVRRYSFSWSLATGAIRLATFSAREPWLLIVLLSLGTIPPFVELKNRGRPTRLYVLHMALFVGLLVAGWAAIERAGGPSTSLPWWTILPLMAAILVRCGTVPAHCWVTDWFEHASIGIALLNVVPLSGVYAAIRLVLPVAPDWVLRGIGLISLTTAVYAAGMATIQREARRFYAHLFLSHAALVLVGLELHTAMSLTACLLLWIAVILSLGGFGLTLRALEARVGRLSLTDYHGLYGHSPTLAVCFLLMGLACVGFPGTIGFIATELLVDSAVEASPYVGIAVVAAAALNGIAVLRAYFLLFTGARHYSSVSLSVGSRERFAALTLSAIILGGGVFPQPGVSSRYRAAEDVLENRLAGPPVAGLARQNTVGLTAKDRGSTPPYENLDAPRGLWSSPDATLRDSTRAPRSRPRSPGPPD